jgi:serine/threonine protein kinase
LKFRAPEEYAFLEENEMIDIYSMGNIFYAMLSGNMPFEGQKESKAQKKVLDGVRPKIPTEVVESDDTAIQTLISITKKCWSKKPIDRPKAASVRDELKELLDRLMTSANATIEADEIMR